MASINMQSILSKARKYTQSDSFQKKIEAKTDDIILRGGISKGKRITISGINIAAAKFIEVLQNEIKSHAIAEGGGGLNGRGLGVTAVSALTKLEHGAPVRVGKNQYQIEIWFGGSETYDEKYLQRESLAPDYFDEGIDNIAALLNKGYSASNTVYGIWAGSQHGYASSFNIQSLQEREGLHFIESAIHNYMANYSNEFGIIDIKVKDIYN